MTPSNPLARLAGITPTSSDWCKGYRDGLNDLRTAENTEIQAGHAGHNDRVLSYLQGYRQGQQEKNK